ncbi:winged helix DNA-binding protein [Novosphingobium sp. Leaf2]|uniref:winged helix DNA-binding protein n=1 Tax=Novosphingobium sp. Leaf2 TaxID=1735670 RepID=UPI0006F6FD4A|nr:winged helix DNA-binding protein [Novosphingobium sp. Leaf2]KQM17500.1 MarR family transcriptional regulator [Novosphingobium sp. Leaf2]
MENTDQLMRNRAKAIRLIGIANELLAMARELEIGESPSMLMKSLANKDEPRASEKSTASQDHPIWVELARQTYEDRRRRIKIFRTDDLFGEPAWDILLDLFIAAKERRRVSVTSACIGSAVPSTTALRWIAQLEKHGLLVREADPGDARRVYVKLSAKGYAAMLEYFASASRAVVRLDEAQPATLARLISYQ